MARQQYIQYSILGVTIELTVPIRACVWGYTAPTNFPVGTLQLTVAEDYDSRGMVVDIISNPHGLVPG